MKADWLFGSLQGNVPRGNRRNWVGLLTAFSLASLLSSCGFSGRIPTQLQLCSDFDDIGFSEVSGDPPVLVFEIPGTVKVMHGFAGASAKGKLVKVAQSAELPAYANQAAVFANGWEVSYAGSDQHLGAVASFIARIKVQPGKITWAAAGGLRDDDAKETFNWSYHYTVIAWNDTALRMMVDQNDTENFCKTNTADGSDNMFLALNTNSSTAQACFPSLLSNPGFATGRTVAVLPRGFGISYYGDHHLLQFGYNLESGAPFVSDQKYYKGPYNTWINPLQGTLSAEVGGYVSWNSYALLKDNSKKREFGFGEVVSALGGPDVEVIQPPYSLDPHTSANGGTIGSGVKTKQIVIKNLPYTCAVPLLTGWDIGYITDDQHVKQMGIWLDEIRYDKAPGSPTGILHYRVNSVVRDNDDEPDNYFTHKVTVLGLKAEGPGVIK